MTLEKNTLLSGRYRILEVLGQGGMGAIYRARDENLGVEVAIKENLFQTDEYIRQFRREAVILANLRHPNLPRVSDHFVIDRQGQYLVMDFIEGEDLRLRMDRLGVIPDEEVIVIGAAICDALSYLHSRNPPILHRDIKPGNIKINPEGEIYLLDFGLAKVVQDREVTSTGARAMTPGYSSPEQYGTARTDARSDVYSLGATLYAALTGALPEDGLARAMDQADLTPVRKRNAKVSKNLARVIEKSLAISPEQRYQNPDEFKRALLEASATKKGRVSTRERTVVPPPEGGIRAVVDGRSKKLDPISEGASPGPGDASSPERRRGGHRLQRLLLWASLIVLVFVGGVIAYAVGTGTAPQIVSLLVSSPTPTVTFTSTIPPSPTEVVLVAPFSETPAPTATLSPTPTMSSTFTVTPTATPSWTETLLPLVNTPTGGGAGEIVFASTKTGEAQIWLVNADGTELRQITALEGGACQPAWSPDGTQIAFIAPCESNQLFYADAVIYVMNADGSGSRVLPVPEGSFDPAWSPDGKSLLYTTFLDFNTTHIYRLDLDDNTAILMTGNDKLNFHPAWSPDGSRFAFVSSLSGGYRIYIKDNDPEADPVLFSRSGGRENTFPTWSPGGEAVMFSQRLVSGGVPSLIRLGLDMLGIEVNEYYETRVIGSYLTPALEPDYSPDGLWVIYESWPDGVNHDIYLLQLQAMNFTRLTTDAAEDFDPAWRPMAP